MAFDRLLVSWISIDYKNKNTFNPDQSQLLFTTFLKKFKNYSQADHIFKKDSQKNSPQMPQKALYKNKKRQLLLKSLDPRGFLNFSQKTH